MAKHQARDKPLHEETAKPADARFDRYGRYWAVYDEDGELVCLTVYKRGAVEVMRRLVLNRS